MTDTTNQTAAAPADAGGALTEERLTQLREQHAEPARECWCTLRMDSDPCDMRLLIDALAAAREEARMLSRQLEAAREITGIAERERDAAREEARQVSAGRQLIDEELAVMWGERDQLRMERDAATARAASLATLLVAVGAWRNQDENDPRGDGHLLAQVIDAYDALAASPAGARMEGEV